MTHPVRRSPNAFVVEVARFLRVEPRDVKRMIEMDGLPAVRVAKKSRSVWRIYLPSFHRWWLERARNPEPGMRDYEAFAEAFGRQEEGSPGE